MSKTKEGGNHVEHDAQFENIAAMVLQFQSSGRPVVSITTEVASPGGFPFLIPTATASMVQITPGSRSDHIQVTIPRGVAKDSSVSKSASDRHAPKSRWLVERLPGS